MGSPTVKEGKVISGSSIYNTKQSSIFIFKCKNKSYIYGYVDICVFLIEETILVTGFAKFEELG